MKRLHWPVVCAGLLLFGIVFGAGSAVSAQTFTEGKHYTRVADESSPRKPGEKIEVREFFWYGCPHCYTLEPHIKNWKKPKDIELITTPAVLGKNWVAHAYAYYALKDLGRLEELHEVLFDALHAERKRLYTAEQLAEFFEEHGVDKDKFKQAFESFSVNTQVKRAERLGKAYSIKSVPTFVIGGKYMTSPSMVDSYTTFFKVVDYLVERARG